MDEWWCMRVEERDQRGTAMEGIEDPSWGRPRGKTREDDEIERGVGEGAMNGYL